MLLQRIKNWFLPPPDKLTLYFEGLTVGDIAMTMNSEQLYLAYCVCERRNIKDLLKTLVLYKIMEESRNDAKS